MASPTHVGRSPDARVTATSFLCKESGKSDPRKSRITGHPADNRNAANIPLSYSAAISEKTPGIRRGPTRTCDDHQSLSQAGEATPPRSGSRLPDGEIRPATIMLMGRPIKRPIHCHSTAANPERSCSRRCREKSQGSRWARCIASRKARSGTAARDRERS